MRPLCYFCMSGGPSSLYASMFVYYLYVCISVILFFSFLFYLFIPILIKDMDALKYIDVASNLIRLIENGTFANTPNLRTVHLEYNILTDTSAITAPQLRSVFLDGNVHLHRGISKVSKRARGWANPFRWSPIPTL